jgi:uncharacterized protein YjiS (DUF1127 family)
MRNRRLSGASIRAIVCSSRTPRSGPKKEIIMSACLTARTAAARRPAAGAATASPAALLRLLVIWQERIRTRRALRTLDDRLAADIGICRAAIDAEAAKPFWKA